MHSCALLCFKRIAFEKVSSDKFGQRKESSKAIFVHDYSIQQTHNCKSVWKCESNTWGAESYTLLSDDNEKNSNFTAVLRVTLVTNVAEQCLEIRVLLQRMNCAKAFLKTIILRPVSSNNACEICLLRQLCEQIMQIVKDRCSWSHLCQVKPDIASPSHTPYECEL